MLDIDKMDIPEHVMEQPLHASYSRYSFNLFSFSLARVNNARDVSTGRYKL